MSKPRHSPAEAKVFRKAASGDASAVEHLVVTNMGLVVKVANYYSARNPHLDPEDLQQTGVEGMLRAISKFDVDKGYRFSTYATYWIRQKIQRHVVACHSRSMSAGKSDTESYMHGTADDDLIALYELRCFSSLSLNGEAGNGQEGELSDIIPSDEDSAEEQAYSRIAALELGRKLTLVADDRDAWIFTEYHGLFGRRPRTMREIGEEIGITGQAVRMVLDRVMTKLRAEFGVDDDG